MQTGLATIDVTNDQERGGSTRSADGLSEKKFMEHCWDIQDQPNFRRQMDRESDYYDGNQLTADTAADLRENRLDQLAGLAFPFYDGDQFHALKAPPACSGPHSRM